MIINICFEEIKIISLENEFDVFLDNLMTCYREGKHVVVIEPKALIFLIKRVETSDRNRKILEHLYSKFSTHNSIVTKINRFINVTLNIENTVFRNGKKIINLSFLNFLDSNTIQKTILLVENSEDANLYTLIAKYFSRNSDLGEFNFQSAVQTGGGNTIVKEFKSIYENKERFCLCILDRDKKSCNVKNWGDTAHKVVKYWKTKPFNNLKCDYIILPLLELENLIPIGFYDSKHGKDYINPSYDISYNNMNIYLHNFPFLRRYIDFKKDTIYEDVFWKSYPCYDNIECIEENNKKILFKSYGTNIAEKFLKLEYSAIETLINSDTLIRNIWLRLGRILCQLLIGTNPIRVI